MLPTPAHLADLPPLVTFPEAICGITPGTQQPATLCMIWACEVLLDELPTLVAPLTVGY